MEHQTFIRIEPNGEKVFKDKKSYDTLDEAILSAKKKNSEYQTIHKLVAYKCKVYFKYHIEKSEKLLKDKEKDKFKQNIYGKKEGLNIIKKIDLDKINYGNKKQSKLK